MKDNGMCKDELNESGEVRLPSEGMGMISELRGSGLQKCVL